MSKRVFYYDDCSDGGRYLREWTATTPARWAAPILFDGKMCYNFLNAAAVRDCLVNQVTGRMSDVEVKMLIGSQNTVDPNCSATIRKRDNGTVDLTPGDVAVFVKAANIEIYLTVIVNTATLIDAAAHGITWDGTKLYWLRFRIIGNLAKAKIWERDEPEPDWQAVGNCVVGTVEANSAGYLALRTQGTVANPNRYWSDIRVIPIPLKGVGTV